MDVIICIVSVLPFLGWREAGKMLNRNVILGLITLLVLLVMMVTMAIMPPPFK
jgi:hypothetical protein